MGIDGFDCEVIDGNLHVKEYADRNPALEAAGLPE